MMTQYAAQTDDKSHLGVRWAVNIEKGFDS
jgi:hypothetical protein